MSFQDFVKELTSKGLYEEPHVYTWMPASQKKKEKDKQPAKPRLSVRWRTGGECGGSCWDDGTEDRHHAVDADDEPEFAELDRIFEALYPDISYLKYKKFCKDHVHTSSETENEYYGNYTVYAIKYIELEDLYNFLYDEEKVYLGCGR